MPLRLYRVAGRSMLPAYGPGDFILARRVRRRGLRPGDVVVADHARYGRVVKRIRVIDANGSLHLAGDNALESTPAHVLGVSPQQVLGKVICRVAAPFPTPDDTVR